MNEKVFVSYAHSSPAFSDRVLDFSNTLRKLGVDCEIDQYEESPPEGWPKWMLRQIQEAKFVLVICSETFYRRANDFSGCPDGLGVKWETTLILQQLYMLNVSNTKFIPILMNRGDKDHIPLPLQPYTFYDVSIEAEMTKLVSRLRGTSTTKRPPIGQPDQQASSPLETKERKSMFFSSIIDVELWNSAKWNGMVFIGDRDRQSPPIVAFMFEHPKYGREIFSRLKKQFGDIDVEEEIRLSFIEEISKTSPEDYKVHIGLDWNAITKKMTKIGLNPQESMFVGVTRIHEMNPPSGSRNLARFKSDYYYFNTYFITNIIQVNGQITPDFDNLIQKKKVFFRRKADVVINPNDEDIACFGKN